MGKDKASIEEKRKFFSDLKYEFKKITWPTKEKTMSNIAIVLSSILLLGTFVFLLDWGFSSLLGLCIRMA